VAIKLIKEPRLDAKLQAFKYQTDAVEAIRDLPYGAIFHEQGLGKSKIAVDIILYWLEKKIIDTVIVVAKKGLVENWKRELTSHTYLKPRILSGNRNENFHVLNSPARIILTHYEAVKLEKNRLVLFLKTRSVGVVLDESTKIKNPDSELTQAFLELATGFKRRVILTGTPVANRPYDVWAQIFFLDQGNSLGNDFKEFQKTLDLRNELASDAVERMKFENALVDIQNKISSFTVRENKNSEFINLPDKVIKPVWTDWEPTQYDLYCQYRDSLKAIVIKEGMPSEDKAEEIIKRLLRLVQIASNPILVDEGYHFDPGKWHYLIALLDEIRSKGEKAIVWTVFTENADWLTNRLRTYGTTKIHGKLSMEQRNKSVKKFLDDPDCKILVATPGAAKEGLTLTVANHVIFFDRSFSLDDYLQAQDRIHRVSQINTCYVYNLMMHDSIDGWVDVLLQAKRLAAQLAQGDISLEYFQSQMTYSFGDVLREILNIKEG
jgi:SNF2 family DNA or RNA helicase